jgi:hypothetical protein
MRTISLALLLMLSNSTTASVFGTSFYNCPNEATARSCSGCSKNSDIDVRFEVNTTQQTVSVTTTAKGRGTITKRFKGCTVVSKTNWECVEELELRISNTQQYYSRTEWSTVDSKYFNSFFSGMTGDKPTGLHACVK